MARAAIVPPNAPNAHCQYLNFEASTIENTQREHYKGDHRYGIKQAVAYARIVPSPATTASPPT
jgi:hypothetical protein